MKLSIYLVLIFVSNLNSFPLSDDYFGTKSFHDDEDDLEELPLVEYVEFNRIGRLLADPNILEFEETPVEIPSNELTDSRFNLEDGDFYQGDIELSEDQIDILNMTVNEDESDDEFGTRTGLLWEGYRWSKNSRGKVVVPYTIAPNQFCEYFWQHFFGNFAPNWVKLCFWWKKKKDLVDKLCFGWTRKATATVAV